MNTHKALIVMLLVFVPAIAAPKHENKTVSFSVTKHESGKPGYPEVPAGHLSVYGAANKPGLFKYEPNLNVAQAIEMAGGFTRFASPTTFSIISRDQMVMRMWGVSINSEEGLVLYSRILLNEGDTLLIHENGGF